MSSFIVKDVRIFTGEETIDEGFIYVQDGKIHSLGPASSAPQASVQSISKPGHTLLPGLIDCHIHAEKGNPTALPQALRFGVTTVCDMHNELPNVQRLQKQTLEPDTASYKTTGTAATVENGWPAPVITALDKSPETLAEIATWPKLTDRQSVIDYLDWNQKEMQPDYIKLMHESGTSMGLELNYPSADLQKTIIEECNKRGLRTVAHALCLKDTIEILNAGTNGLTHTICDQPPTQELVDAYKKNNAWLNPTLATIGSLTAEGKELQEKYAHDKRVESVIGEKGVAALCNCMSMAAGHGKVEYAYESVRVLKAAGIDIVCGSDSAGPAVGTAFGLTMHHEMYLFVNKVGMTPTEALRAATSVTARRFGFTDRGKLAEGLNADLLLVEGNPLEEIDDTLNIRGVWRKGRLCSAYAANLPVN